MTQIAGLFQNGKYNTGGFKPEMLKAKALNPKPQVTWVTKGQNPMWRPKSGLQALWPLRRFRVEAKTPRCQGYGGIPPSRCLLWDHFPCTLCGLASHRLPKTKHPDLLQPRQAHTRLADNDIPSWCKVSEYIPLVSIVSCLRKDTEARHLQRWEFYDGAAEQTMPS